MVSPCTRHEVGRASYDQPDVHTVMNLSPPQCLKPREPSAMCEAQKHNIMYSWCTQYPSRIQSHFLVSPHDHSTCEHHCDDICSRNTAWNSLETAWNEADCNVVLIMHTQSKVETSQNGFSGKGLQASFQVVLVCWAARLKAYTSPCKISS